MAKKENRRYINFECSECKNRNYTKQKNFVNTTNKLELKKHCPTCRKHTLHIEISK
ncbi:50S ribosomal protein L33 [Patescibacteria group bacterium]|nr:50S ribosomal protein L33 [Patescibacteria group bacterium]